MYRSSSADSHTLNQYLNNDNNNISNNSKSSYRSSSPMMLQRPPQQHVSRSQSVSPHRDRNSDLTQHNNDSTTTTRPSSMNLMTRAVSSYTYGTAGFGDANNNNSNTKPSRPTSLPVNSSYKSLQQNNNNNSYTDGNYVSELTIANMRTNPTVAGTVTARQLLEYYNSRN